MNGLGCTKVAVLLPDAVTPRWQALDQPLLAQWLGKIPGLTADFFDAGGDATTQLSQAEAALAGGDCILVVAPVDPVAAAQIAAAGKAREVPVIAYDRLVQSADLSFFVGFDRVAAGTLQGQYIAANYKGFAKGMNVHLAIIGGSATDPDAVRFEQGLHQALQPLLDTKAMTLVYDVFTPNADPPTAGTEVQGILTAQQDNVQLVSVASDAMAASVCFALAQQRLTGAVLVASQGGTVPALQAILTGKLTTTIYEPVMSEARATALLVKTLQAGADTAVLTGGATVSTSAGAAIPAVLSSPVAADRMNLAQTVLADGTVTMTQLCQGLTSAQTNGFCP